MSSPTQDTYVPVSPVLSAAHAAAAPRTFLHVPGGRVPSWGNAYAARTTPAVRAAPRSFHNVPGGRVPYWGNVRPTSAARATSISNPPQNGRQRSSPSAAPRRPPSHSAPRQHNSTPHVADAIIEKHFKSKVPKSQTEAAPGKTTGPQHAVGDYYRPSQANRQAPRRLNDRQVYSSWSKSRLLEEVDRRHLRHEHDGLPQLVDILLVNDRKFFEIKGELRELNVRELLRRASLEHLNIKTNKHWRHEALLTEMAEEMAQVAVTQHINVQAAKQASKKSTQDTQKSDSGYSSYGTRSTRSFSSSSADDNEDVQLIDRGRKHIMHRRDRAQGPSKDRTDEVHSPTKGKKRARSTESDNESEEDGEIRPPKKARSAPAKKVDKANQVQSSKSDHKSTASPDSASAKVPTTGPPKAAPKRKAPSSNDNEEDSGDEPVRSTRPTKRQKASEPEPEFEDSDQSSKTDSESDKEEAVKKRRKVAPRQTTAPKKLKGIPASERVPGLPYTKLADGSFKLSKSAAAKASRPKAKPEPRHNYIRN
jgi:hypothetical protein